MTRPAALLLTVVIALLLAAHSADYLIHHPLYELGDAAANSLSVDRAKHFAELYGPYSRWGFHHPGPAFFYVQALGEWLFFDTLGIAPAPFNGQLLLCLVVEVGFFIAALQIFLQWLPSRCRWWFFPAAFFLAALHFGNPGTWRASALSPNFVFLTTWSAEIVVIIMLSLLTASASVAAGRSQDLPLLVTAGGCLVHLHVAQPMFVVPCALLAYAGLIGSSSPLPDDGPVSAARGRKVLAKLTAPWRQHRRPHIVAGVILAIFLLPLLVDLTRGSHSNLAAILQHLHEYHALHKPWLTSVLYFLQFGAYTSYRPGQVDFGPYTTAGAWRYLRDNAPCCAVWAITFGLAGWALCRPLFRAKRQPAGETGRFLAWAAANLFLAVALTLRWGVIQDGDMYYFNAYFNLSIYFFAALIAVALVLHSFWARLASSNNQPPGPTERGVTIVTALLGIALMVDRMKIDDPGWASHVSRHDQITRVIADSANAHTVKFLNFPPLYWPYMAGVAVQLDRAHERFVVPGNWKFMFGSEHAQKPDLAGLFHTNFQKWSLIEQANAPAARSASEESIEWEGGTALTIAPASVLDVDKNGAVVLDFQLGKSSPAFEIDGWCGSEAWGEWSDGKRAVLAFRALPVSEDVQLTLNVFPYLDPAHGLTGQRLRVSCNGQRVGPELRLDRPEPPPLVLTIPQSVWNRVRTDPNSNTVLELELPDAISPQDLDPSQVGDLRCIAIGVRSISLSGAGSSQAATTAVAAPLPGNKSGANFEVPSEYTFNGQPLAESLVTGISADGWAARKATLLLPNSPGADAPFLRLAGDAPQRPGITYPYRFQAAVGAGAGTEATIEKPGPFEVLVPLEIKGSNDRDITLRLDFPQTFVPARTDPASNDNRELAILLRSVSITNAAQPVFASFGQGWYDRETDHQDWWRWSNAESTVELAAARAGTLLIQGMTGVIMPENSVDVSLDGTLFTTLSMKNAASVPFEARVPISAGKHRLTFHSRLPGIQPPGETRTIAFGMRNATFELE